MKKVVVEREELERILSIRVKMRTHIALLLCVSAKALQLPRRSSRIWTARISSTKGDSQEVTDLNLEEMFDIFEAADKEVSNEEVGMPEETASSTASNTDLQRSFLSGDISKTPMAYQVGLGIFVAGWAVILGGIATGNPVI